MAEEDKRQGGVARPVWVQNFDDFPSPSGSSNDDSLAMSEFGEQRVAAPGNRADVEFLYDKQPLLVDEVLSGTGTATWDSNSRDVELAVAGAANGASSMMRLHYWVPYTPGSGQEIDITGTMDATGIGTGTMSAFLRSSVSGSEVVTELPYSGWGVAGVNPVYSQIFRISFQSLRVGRIQFSLVRDGLPVKIGEITNDNIRGTGYWQYANLPPYWRVYNTATQTIVEFGYGDDANGVGFMYKFAGVESTATAKAICCTVKSQGGAPLFDMPGFPFTASQYTSPKSVGTALIPILSIRNKASFGGVDNRAIAIPKGYNLLVSEPMHYKVIYRPTLTGASWTSVDDNSTMEFDTAATAISGGIEVGQGYLYADGGGFFGGGYEGQKDGLLGRNIMAYGDEQDILTIAGIRTDTSNSLARAAISWSEIR